MAKKIKNVQPPLSREDKAKSEEFKRIMKGFPPLSLR